MTRRFRIHALVATLAVLVGIGGAGSAASAQGSAPILGINSHGLEEAPRRMIRGANLENVRWTLYWDRWVEDAAYREWNRAQLRDALRELDVLVVLHGADPHPGRADPMRRYAAFLGQLASEFPGARWQVWNEVDGDHMTALFRAATMRERGRRYGRQMAEVRRAAPDAFLVASGVSPEAAPEFWAGMRETGPEPDALAVHVFGPPLGQRVRSVAGAVRRAADGTPVWATEFGVEARADHGITEAAQRDNWQAFDAAAAGLFQRAYGYALGTDEAGRFGPREVHGIVRPDGSPRPAYEWLRRRARRGGG